MAFSFGSSSAPSLFGAGSAPAASGTTAPSLFGSVPALDTSASSGLFGGSTPAASSASLFGSTPSPLSGSGFGFGASTGSLFGGSSTSQGAFGFGQQSAPSYLTGQQQTPVPAGVLATVDNKQLTHYTKWDEINPQGLQQLLDLEKIILHAKDDSQQLDACARLQDAASTDSGSQEAGLKHTIQGFSSTWSSQAESITALNERVHELLQDTEVAIRTFERSYRWREAAKANPGQVIPPAVREMLSGPVVLPSDFLKKAITKFQENVVQYKSMTAELERLLPLPTAQQTKSSTQPDASEGLLKELSTTINNTHDLLYHVAAKMDALNERIENAKRLHLEARRRAGDLHDPFKEAHRREQSKEQAARTKLTIIPPAVQQLQGQQQQRPASALSSSAPGGAFPSGAAGPTPFGSPGVGMFNPSSSPSLFGGNDSGAKTSTSRSRKVKK